MEKVLLVSGFGCQITAAHFTGALSNSFLSGNKVQPNQGGLRGLMKMCGI